MTDIVFVYGTLKRNAANYRVMQAAGGEYVAPATLTISGYQFVSMGGFPALARIAGDDTERTTVTGELFRVDADGLRRLDALEGYPTHYTRRVVKVDRGYGEPVSAWVYLLVRELSPRYAGRVIVGNRWNGYVTLTVAEAESRRRW